MDENGKKVSDSLTVAPLTQYKARKEIARSLWSVIITNRDDVYVERHNARYFRLKHWETDEYGNWLVDEDGSAIPFRSLIDFGQLSTISATALGDTDNELCWNRRFGKLTDEKILSVDAALQVVLGGAIRSTQDLPVQEGYVLNVNLPERNRVSGQRCLVVSSSGIDAVREHIEVEIERGKPKMKLRHCTIIPLLKEEGYQNIDGLTDVVVYPKDDQQGPETIEVAVCTEIYTVDWQARRAKVVGQVPAEHMRKVREELWKYLDLPL
jgi:mRNA-degrading endonuclease toxin of MazEF toxin-antitoxin module